MIRSARRFACLAVVVALAAAAMPIPAPKAQASHGDGPKFTAWLEPGSSITYDRVPICHLIGRVGMQEFGEHSVQRFKWRATAYGFDTDIGQDFLGSIIGSTGWYYSEWFTNTTKSAWWKPSYALWVNVARTDEGRSRSAVIKVKAVGIRDSFWKKDFVAWVKIGACSTPIEATG